jgi:uncharacterized protein YjbI with pentapeptide repeats
MEILEIWTLEDFGNIVTILAFILTLIAGLYKLIEKLIERINRNELRKVELKELNESFRSIVKDLSSDNIPRKIASAILLRRFLEHKNEFNNEKALSTETINLIAGILRFEKTSEFQKILGDGLAFAKDLSEVDLQKTNLQNIYFSRFKDLRLIKTDFFGADLSRASLKNLDATQAIFYEARLEDTIFIETILINADFRNSNLLGAKFNKAKLIGAKFNGAINIPSEVKKHLNKQGIYEEKEVNEYEYPSSKIFLSTPNTLTIDQTKLFEYVKEKLKKESIEVITITRDNYQYFGIVSEIKRKIQQSDAVIAFGFSDIEVKEGIFKPNTKEQSSIKNFYYISPWIHTEIGIAIGSSKPLFILYEDKVDNGIFEKNCDEVCYEKILVNCEDLSKIIDKIISKIKKT